MDLPTSLNPFQCCPSATPSHLCFLAGLLLLKSSAPYHLSRWLFVVKFTFQPSHHPAHFPRTAQQPLIFSAPTSFFTSPYVQTFCGELLLPSFFFFIAFRLFSRPLYPACAYPSGQILLPQFWTAHFFSVWLFFIAPHTTLLSLPFPRLLALLACLPDSHHLSPNQFSSASNPE